MNDLSVVRVAKRLGLTKSVIRQLQAHGLLERLPVTSNEIDERLRRAYLDVPPAPERMTIVKAPRRGAS